MKRAAAALPAALLIALTLVWPAPGTLPRVPVRRAPLASGSAAVAMSVRAPAPVQARSAVPAHAVSFDSLRGTRVDGAVNPGADALPRADRDLRRLFDYFLARLGERDPATIRADLDAHLRDALRLGAAARTQVLAWFDLYVEGERAVAALPRSGDPVRDAALLRRTHQRYLGGELAQAWFFADDDYAAYTAQRVALQRDARIDAQQLSQRLDELDATLDPAEREGRQQATDFQIAVAQSRELAAADAGADARFVERAALWGDAAALRLGALDDADARWNTRMHTYALARARLLGDAALGERERAARLDALLEDFSAAEQRRVLSLAQANLLPTP